MLPVADSTIVATATDGVLLVLRAGQTRTQAVKQTLDMLRRANVPVIGVVLNDVPAATHSYYGYYYGRRAPQANVHPGNKKLMWPRQLAERTRERIGHIQR